MIVKNRIKTVLALILVAMASVSSVANGTMIIDLIGDEVNTVGSNSTYGTETEHLAGLLNDPFAYDPDNPTSPMPQTTWEVGKFFHGTDTVLAIIAYDFDTVYTEIFVDLYGRSDCCRDRDDSFNVEFWLGGVGGVLQETVAGSIDDVTLHDRVTASSGTQADSIRIVETAASPNNFTLCEIRANGVDDPNLPSVYAGVDMITWSGQPVQLDPTVVNNDSEIPQRTLSYLWNAEPIDGVVFSPSDIVEAPAVTITKTTTNPSPVTLTLAVTLEGKDPVTNSLVIDVYDDTCLAAKAAGTGLDPTDIDENCVTSLADFAELAEDWLGDYTLTEPAPKP